MSAVKEKCVRFALEEKAPSGSIVDLQGSADAPVDAAQTKGEASDPNVTAVEESVKDEDTLGGGASNGNATKAVVKDRIAAPLPRSKYIYCSECGQDIPIREWPDHRDRLRKVELVRRVGVFHRMLIRLVCDFLLWLLKHVYFREVTVVGAENIPKAGAVVFYGNHQNQFIDALMIGANCGRPIRFTMAEKSFHRPVVGSFGRLFNSVPVIRPQDVPLIAGEGRLVRMEGNIIEGVDTHFLTCVGQGDVILWVAAGNVKSKAQVSRIISDTVVEATMPIQTESMVTEGTTFSISRRIDHSEMYAQIYDTLENNHCIAIFPEGGSHDRTSLLPLKAGVALFSLGAAERNISVKVVPCGLTYFYGHKFRSRAYIEFGEPIVPPDDLVSLFNRDKRGATGLFLEQLNAALHDVTINVPDWGTLNFLHSFRQLYQPSNCTLSPRNYLCLTRRLGVLIDKGKDNDKLIEFRRQVSAYNDFCNALLVRDSQAATLRRLGSTDGERPELRLLFRRSFTLFLMIVILLPFFVVGLPVGAFIEYMSTKQTRKALAESKVKVVGADVKGSYKLLLGFILIPLEVLFVSVLVFFFTDTRTALVMFFSLPMAMYVSLIILQEAVLELRAALPLFMSLLSNHKQFKKLYEKREELVQSARGLVREMDPQLEEEMKVYTVPCETEDVAREPSLFSLRYNVRKRLASTT